MSIEPEPNGEKFKRPFEGSIALGWTSPRVQLMAHDRHGGVR